MSIEVSHLAMLVLVVYRVTLVNKELMDMMDLMGDLLVKYCDDIAVSC